MPAPRTRAKFLAAAAVSLAVVLLVPLVARADFPYPKPPPGTDPSAFGRYAFLPQKDPPEVPNDFDDDWKLSSGKTGEAAIDSSPQELFGVRGASVDKAWQVTTGRPDVRISVLDSGIRWQEALPDLVNKFFINRGELPRPQGSRTYDKNRDGVFNVQDYAGDTRVGDRNGNGLLDPQDLIKAFSDGRDDDHNGYVDDISGWDFAEDDNDPADLVRYGHGTGESEDSSAEANNGTGGVGSCPNCMLIEERVGDSFVADVNHFAPAVGYAVDNGASVVQEALGTVNNSSFARDAVQYAYRHNVAVIASAADEEAKHHNYPSNYPDTITVNSVTKFDSGESPHSYLFLNGCTNYGGHMAVAIPSSSCSSEATGKAAGMAGLLYSAARNAGRRLTSNEVRQLFTMKADDIDFLTAKPPAPAANFATSQSVASRRFPSIPGYDEYFGYGRANADRMVRAVASGNIPPEAEITDPDWYTLVSPADGRLVVRGRVDARRARSYGYEVSVGRGTIKDPGAPGFGAPNESPLESEMHPLCSSRGLHRSRHGVLCSVSIARLRAALGNPPTSGPLDIPAGNGDPDRFSFTIRVRVRDDHDRTGEDRRSAFLHQDADAVPGFPRRLPSDGETSPRLADLNGDGVDDVLLGTSDGIVHAYRGGSGFGRSELPGWPVQTSLLPTHRAAPAYRAGLLRGRHAAAVALGGGGRRRRRRAARGRGQRRVRLRVRVRPPRAGAARVPGPHERELLDGALQDPGQPHGPRLPRGPDAREPRRQAGPGDRGRRDRPPPLRVDPRRTAAERLPGAARGPDQGPVDRPDHARGHLQARRRPASGHEDHRHGLDRGHRRRRARRHRGGHERGVPRAHERHGRDLQRARQHRGRLQLAALRGPLDRQRRPGLALPARLPGQDRAARLRDPAGGGRRGRRPARAGRSRRRRQA